MDQSIIDLLKPETLAQSDDQAELRFCVRDEFTIPTGQVQGGIVASMLDMAMAFAAEGKLSTASLHIDILRPATGEALDVKGRVIRRGRRLLFAEAEMFDVKGRLIARGLQTAVPLD